MFKHEKFQKTSLKTKMKWSNIQVFLNKQLLITVSIKITHCLGQPIKASSTVSVISPMLSIRLKNLPNKKWLRLDVNACLLMAPFPNSTCSETFLAMFSPRE